MVCVSIALEVTWNNIYNVDIWRLRYPSNRLLLLGERGRGTHDLPMVWNPLESWNLDLG